jgi:hypothetical protein
VGRFVALEVPALGPKIAPQWGGTMWDDFVSQQIRRTNRNLLILGTALLAIVATVVSLTWREVYNYVFGPFPIQASDLATIWNPDQPKRYYLKVQGDKSYTTGMQVVDRDNKENVRAVVVALMVGKKFLLVKTPADNHQLEFKGALVAMPPEVQSGAVQPIEEKYPDLKNAFLPFMLDATGFRNSDDTVAAIFGLLITGTGLFVSGLPLFRMARPEKHPLFAKLEKYGQLQVVRARIDSEMRGEGGGKKFGGLRITTNWLINAAPYKTDAMAAEDIIWAYPKVTKHYHSGIPTGKTYSAIVRDSKGQSMEVSGKKDSVPKLLELLKGRMPWLLVGYTKELEALWQKQKPQFFQLMERRRTELLMASR